MVAALKAYDLGLKPLTIEGLYAKGNTASSVMGHTYLGAGATIGASMIFGYITANVITEKVRSSDSL